MKYASSGAEVKAKIQDKEGIRPDKQRVFYCERLIQDDDLLSFHYIQKGSTLHLAVDSEGGEQIFVKTFAEVAIAVVARLNFDTIGDLKVKIQAGTLLLPWGYQTLDLELGDLVEVIKRRIDQLEMQ